jgi:hypothetical protein
VLVLDETPLDDVGRGLDGHGTPPVMPMLGAPGTRG